MFCMLKKKKHIQLKQKYIKNNDDFFCLNCPHSFRTKSKLESHKQVCENKYFRNIVMPSEETEILEFNQYHKCDKAPFLIYADLECIIEKIDEYKNNLKIPLQHK